MGGKTCLITGATDGIGREVALRLASEGCRLIVFCRNMKKGNTVIEKLISINKHAQHQLIVADLSDIDSIKRGVELLRQCGDKLDILINNAGLFCTKRKYSSNGIEMQFAVNYLAPFFLTNLLLTYDIINPAGRIINVSSISHYFGRIHLDDLYYERCYEGMRAYEQSKLAVVLFTLELLSRLGHTLITVNCLSPGRVNTNIGSSNASGFYKLLWNWNRPLLISPEKGAQTYLYLAGSDEVAQITGKYFYKCRARRPSFRSRNKETAEKLWVVGETLTGMQFIV